MRIKENLAKILKQKQMTQKELAEKLKAQPSHLNKIVKGYQTPTLEMTVRIAEILMVSLDELVLSATRSPKEIKIEDESLLERINLLNSLDEEERKAIIMMVDALLTKKQMTALLNGNKDAGKNK